MGNFPIYAGRNWVCGECKPSDRNKPHDNERGCCGFKVNSLLVNKGADMSLMSGSLSCCGLGGYISSYCL